MGHYTIDSGPANGGIAIGKIGGALRLPSGAETEPLARPQAMRIATIGRTGPPAASSERCNRGDDAES